MSTAADQTRPLYGWYGDDFTGATDTLSTWAEQGYRALLFLKMPTAEQLQAAGPLDAIGIAGATRSMAPETASHELEIAAQFFVAQGVDILHYKCCSTFDSAPHVGSIGEAIRTLRRHFPNPFVPIVGGQPNLGRYCLFGNLFAVAGTGSTVYRIDRHPTMSVHPVTPMTEADLRKHLAAQGVERIGLIDYRSYEADAVDAELEASLKNNADASLFDVSRVADLAVIGRLINSQKRAGPMLAVGPSSVAQALTAASDRKAKTTSRTAAPQHKGPVLALVGSLSPVTRAQVEAAQGYEKLNVDPRKLIEQPDYREAIKQQTLRLLAAGDVMLVTERPDGAPQQAEQTAMATGQLLRAIMQDATVSRLVVAGGDTSSHAIAALDIWGLSYRGPMVPGAPLCRVHSADPKLDGIDIVLKGGQMGSVTFFENVSGAHRLR
ncbi:MAG: four-carbon acid sugar kinase family protein [Pseudolabrys sp.]|nr:four-carbon acid sugar kinase family protein [Pseudolabrys sp.]